MREPTIRTVSGKTIYLFSCTADDLDLADMAHALSHINRFNGHTKLPFNVACHSVWVSRVVARLGGTTHEARQGLFHDGSEYLLGDVTKWLKGHPSFAAYRMQERRLQALIYRKFGCHDEQSPLVDQADRLLVRAEAELGFGTTLWSTRDGYGPLTSEERVLLHDYDAADAVTSRELFLARAKEVA